VTARRYLFGLVLSAALLLPISSTSFLQAHERGPALAQRLGTPITLVQGTQIGQATFEPGDTARGGTGLPVDGIAGSSREMLAVHIHAHLALFVQGQQIAIPCGIGIVRPFRIDNGFVGAGSGFYWLHTHDATGIIHIESPDARSYTLGNFFDIWGQPLSTHGVAGLNGVVCAFVDGKPYSGDPRAIVFAAHSQITLEVGGPVVPPPVYVFPNGL
jgi:hypothetical protein